MPPPPHGFYPPTLVPALTVPPEIRSLTRGVATICRKHGKANKVVSRCARALSKGGLLGGLLRNGVYFFWDPPGREPAFTTFLLFWEARLFITPPFFLGLLPYFSVHLLATSGSFAHKYLLCFSDLKGILLLVRPSIYTTYS